MDELVGDTSLVTFGDPKIGVWVTLVRNRLTTAGISLKTAAVKIAITNETNIIIDRVKGVAHTLWEEGCRCDVRTISRTVGVREWEEPTMHVGWEVKRMKRRVAFDVGVD
jgi:hypothetical protein